MRPTRSTRDAIALAERVSAPNYHPLPVVIARAEGSWVWDPEGRRYLDFLSAYSALSHGHRHPRIVAAVVEQLGRVTLTSRAFHNDRMGEFLERLCAYSGYGMALPMNTGAEAVETALKLARRWGARVKGVPNGEQEILCAEGNFHGRTTTLISMSTSPEARDGFGPYAPGFRNVPFGDPEALERAISERTVAFLVEPIQGEAGVRVPPEGYLRRVREIATRRGILWIADEIQTGLGRTGRRFACDREGVRPDAVCLGKALGGGVYPVSAVVADRALLSLFDPGSHGSTFGGNPLASAAGIAAIAVLEEERLAERAERLGERFRERLRAIPCPKVREVRGRGLLNAIAFEGGVDGRAVSERLLERGLLAKETQRSVVRFAPPLTISEEELELGISAIESVLGEL